MSKRPRDIFPACDPHFEAGGMKFYFLSEIIALIPRPTRPSRETVLRLIRTGQLRGRRLGKEWIIPETCWAEFLADRDNSRAAGDATS